MFEGYSFLIVPRGNSTKIPVENTTTELIIIENKISKEVLFFIRSSTCTANASYISPPPFPLSFPFFSPEVPLPLLENVTASHFLLCCIAFARGHRKTAENLCRYSQPFHRVCPQSTVSGKMTSRSGPQSTVSEKMTSRLGFDMQVAHWRSSI